MSHMMTREDKLALLDSEVYQELEMTERRKIAQTLSDKIVQSPGAQQAIRDGITKALENKDDDGKMESAHDEINIGIKKLNDHELFEMFQMFANELEIRGIDAEEYEKKFDDEETEESIDGEQKEEDDMEEVFAFVKSSLTKLAYSAADKGNTEAAYLIERCLQKIV